METIRILPNLAGPVESSSLGPLNTLGDLVFRGGRGVGIVLFQDHELTIHVVRSNHLPKFVERFLFRSSKHLPIALHARIGFLGVSSHERFDQARDRVATW